MGLGEGSGSSPGLPIPESPTRVASPNHPLTRCEGGPGSRMISIGKDRPVRRDHHTAALSPEPRPHSLDATNTWWNQTRAVDGIPVISVAVTLSLAQLFPVVAEADPFPAVPVALHQSAVSEGHRHERLFGRRTGLSNYLPGRQSPATRTGHMAATAVRRRHSTAKPASIFGIREGDSASQSPWRREQ